MLEAREVHCEQSELAYRDWRCPECDRNLKGRPAQKVTHSEDTWEYRIRCSCGVIVIAIND